MSFNSIPMPNFLAKTRGGRDLERKSRFSLSTLWLLPALLLLGLPVTGHAQNPSFDKVEEAADEAFQNRDFYNAYKIYQQAVEYRKANLTTQYKLADAARMANLYSTAIDEFSKVMADPEYAALTTGENPDPLISLAPLRLGQIYQVSGNCDAARDFFDTYLAQPNMPESGRTEAEKGIADCDHAEDMAGQLMRDTLIHLGDSVNTYYMEFSPAPLEDKLYYTSFRFDNPGDRVKPRRKLFRMMEMKNGVSDKVFPDSEHEGKHVGHPAFTPDGKRMYYTVCEYVGKSLEIRCDIYYRDSRSGGKWGSPKDVSFNAEEGEFTTTMPNVGVDANGRRVLYFVSDRGGNEDLDIWYAPITGTDSFGEPVRLGNTINSANDDVSPFYAFNEGALYFSTEGKNTLGGLDIYKASGIIGAWSTPVPLLEPFNTTYDDLYFSLTTDELTAYLASDRLVNDSIVTPEPGKERCCHDIFEIRRALPPDLIITVYCASDSYNPFGEINVKVYEEGNYDGEPLALNRIDPAGYHHYSVERGTQYRIVVDTVGFTSVDTIIVIPEELPIPPVISVSFTIDQLLKIEVTDSETSLPIPEAQLTFYNADNPEQPIYPNPDFPKPPGSNTFEFPVRFQAGDSYVMEIVADGYEPLTDDQLLADISPDLVCSPFSLNVPLTPDPPCISEDTIALFFHNDRPGPSSSRVYTTNTIYGATYENYIGMLETYRQEFTRGYPLLTEATRKLLLDSVRIDADAGPARIQSFFENTVEVGKSELDNFCEEIKELLENGVAVDFVIKGFASPKGNPEYNRALSRRRISSVYKHIRDYFGEYAFNQYVEGGLLKIDTTQFNGEDTVIERVKKVLEAVEAENVKTYRQPNPPELDIYTDLAGLERKVEIQVKSPVCGQEYPPNDNPYEPPGGYKGGEDPRPNEYNPYRSYDSGNDNNDN